MLSENARTFLQSPRFAILGTINKDGTPQLSTMWYALDQDEILINTKEGRIKDRNLQRDPRVSICVEEEQQYITISGTARRIDDQEIAQEDIYQLAARYDGATRQQVQETFGTQKRITYRIAIERVFERI